MPDKPQPLFPTLPGELATLSDEQLNAHLDAVIAVVKGIRDGDEEVLGDLDMGAVTEQLEAAVIEVEALRAELAQRAETAAESATRVADLAKRAGLGSDAAEGAADAVAEGDEAEGDDKPEGDEAEGDDAAEGEEPAGDEASAEADAEAERVAVAASARRRQVPARRALGSVPQGKGQHAVQPTPEVAERMAVITAAGDLPGFTAGQALTSGDEIASAMVAKHDALGVALLKGDGEKVPVVTIRAAAEPERTLSENDVSGNMRKIQAVTSRKALAASGGICAPATPYYGLMELAVADRPVRDALPRFNADRGAIRFATPPGLAIVDDAIGIITAEEDAEGGTFALKSCQAVVCPDINEVDVAIIYHCTQFGNLGARTWPEQVAQFNELVLAAHARLAEQALLDGIAAASAATTGTAYGGGATSSILSQIITAAAGYRSRNRMDRNAQLRVLLPSWVQDALAVDVLRSQFMRFDNSDAVFDNQLRQANISPSYYMDTPSGASQVFGAQSDGVLLPFPTTCVWFLFAEGSFLYVDGGTLELGIVRDSTLNSHNDYQIFGETFENIAFVGLESIECTSTFCANGIVSAPAAPGGCVA